MQKSRDGRDAAINCSAERTACQGQRHIITFGLLVLFNSQNGPNVYEYDKLTKLNIQIQSEAVQCEPRLNDSRDSPCNCIVHKDCTAQNGI